MENCYPDFLIVRKRQYNAREPQVRPPRETLLPLMLFAIFNTPLLINPPPPKVLEKNKRSGGYRGFTLRISRAFFQNKKLRAQFPIHRKRAGTEQERQLDRRGRSHHFKKLFVTTEMS